MSGTARGYYIHSSMQCYLLAVLCVFQLHICNSSVLPQSTALSHALASSSTSKPNDTEIEYETLAGSSSIGVVQSEVMVGVGSTIDLHEGVPQKRKVLILYTGGTMGMRRVNGSLAPVPGYLTECIRELPEMHRPEMPSFVIKEYTPLLDSSNMGPSHWAAIAQDIEDNYLDFDGFVVIMGTDTMAYASSALSFMLENLGKTVVFTGSQVLYFTHLIYIHTYMHVNVYAMYIVVVHILWQTY